MIRNLLFLNDILSLYSLFILMVFFLTSFVFLFMAFLFFSHLRNVLFVVYILFSSHLFNLGEYLDRAALIGNLQLLKDSLFLFSTGLFFLYFLPSHVLSFSLEKAICSIWKYLDRAALIVVRWLGTWYSPFSRLFFPTWEIFVFSHILLLLSCPSSPNSKPLSRDSHF